VKGRGDTVVVFVTIQETGGCGEGGEKECVGAEEGDEDVEGLGRGSESDVG